MLGVEYHEPRFMSKVTTTPRPTPQREEGNQLAASGICRLSSVVCCLKVAQFLRILNLEFTDPRPPERCQIRTTAKLSANVAR